MRKVLFLLGRHRFYNLRELERSGANELTVAFEGIGEQRLRELKSLDMKFGLSVTTFENGVCPLDPKSKLRLEKLISDALKWQPQTIWFDHMRFDGHWEAMKRNRLDMVHEPCKWCRRKDKADELVKIAKWIRGLVGDLEMGFFAVPFKVEEVLPVIEEMGQNLVILSEVFNVISPMIYHRMIGKPVGYIHEFVDYMSKATGKPVLPIIQIKDLPDEVPDNFEEADVVQTFKEAVKVLSAGVAWFCWDDAVETGKTGIIGKLFGEQLNSIDTYQ